MEVAIEPRSKADQEKLAVALEKLLGEDHSFRFSTDQEKGQTILRGMDELHLDAKVELLRQLYQVDFRLGAPQVAFRETIRDAGTVDYTHKKQQDGFGEFARVKINLIPGARGSGYAFSSKIVGDAVPEKYIPAVRKGLETVLGSGVLAGFPVVDLRVELINGAYHNVDSTPLAFEIASRSALQEGLRRHSVLLEPIMKVEIVTPEDCTGVVIRDLYARRGQVQQQKKRSGDCVIDALVPLADMFGYVNNLRAMSQGRGSFAMQFDHYQQVPPHDDGGPGAAVAHLG